MLSTLEADGFDHYRFVLTNDGTKQVTRAQIFLGEPAPRKTYDPAVAREMARPAFLQAIHSALPFDYRGSLDPGASSAIVVRLTARRPVMAAILLHERMATCYIGAVRYSDGTGWTHGVHLDVEG